MRFSVPQRLSLDAIAARSIAVDGGYLKARASAALAARSWDFAAPARMVDAMIAASCLPLDDHARRAAVASFALRLPALLEELELPASVVALYPAAFDVLLASLQSETVVYDPDFYAKDVRFVLGLSVPAGAQLVDLYARLGPRLVLRQMRRPGGIRVLRRYLSAGGHRPWLQIHTETRDTSGFNEPGWDDCYVRIADLLRRDPSAAGMLGTSWFYDPAVATISPRLAYLQMPIGQGAFQVWIGSSGLDVERAGTKSPTRKAMIDAGTYLPTAFSLAWPRAALLSWADRRDAAQ